ncbi:MAG: RNA-binding protein [Chloroflexi bacterium]|nr:RNA-binding protein [Chloroflexota bacterium]
MESRLYVGNLPFNAAEEDLRNLFSQAGEVTDVHLVTERGTDRSRGFAFVEFANQADAEKAIQMFSGYDMNGRQLTVNMARPREERSYAGGGGGGGGGGRGRGGSRGRY